GHFVQNLEALSSCILGVLEVHKAKFFWEKNEVQRAFVEAVFSDALQLGESISVDGICVSVESFDQRGFRFTASQETINRTIIGDKRIGDKVHLERALRLGGRLGGHIVQGHVDGVGLVEQLLTRNIGAELRISLPNSLMKYVVDKGSLAVQGVSLTAATVQQNSVTIALIPATLQGTYLGELKSGDRVNVEVDLIAKYVESFLTSRQEKISEETLKTWGFT
ncbi:MAG: riboflavin synthase, partial [bacterium]